MAKIKITKPLLKKISDFASNGLSRTDIGYLLGYSSKSHWLKLMRSSEDLESAFIVGKTNSKTLLEKRIFEKALSADKDALQAGIFILNRHHPITDEAIADDDVGSSIADAKAEILKELSNG